MKSYSKLLELQFLSLTREKTDSHLKMEFEMKDLRKTPLCIDLKLKHCFDGILVYQSNYTPNMLPLSIPLIVHTLYANETLEEVNLKFHI